MQQVFKALEGNHAVRASGQLVWQMKTVNRVEKKERADAFVKIFAVTAECLKLRTGLQQFGGRRPRANGVERLVADFRIR